MLLLLLVLTLVSARPAVADAATAGTAAAGSTDLPTVAVPERTARRLGLRPGDVIEVSPRPFTEPGARRRFRVAVVWAPPEHPADVAREDLLLRFHLPDLESLLAADLVDRVVVRLREPHRAEAVARDLDALVPGVDVYTAEEVARHVSRTFIVVSRFHRAIGFVTLLAGAIFLVTIMSLKLTEMRREIGALRLLGVSRATIGLAVLAIAGAVALLGTLVGMGVGAALVAAINAYYRPLFETRLRFAVLVPQTLLAAAALAVVLGVGAGAAVAARLLRRPPLEQVGR
jgi:putative ABC transport system permease protein